METTTARRYSVLTWSPRVRCYGVIISIGLLYLVIGRFSSDNLTWVQIHLPVSAASLVLIALAGVEACFLVRQWQDRHTTVTALRVREQETALRITAQRLDYLNEVAAQLTGPNTALVLSRFLPRRLATLFDSDVTGVWILDDEWPGVFDLRGLDGLDDARQQAFTVLTKCTPCFAKVAQSRQPVVVENFARDTAPSLAGFCAEEGLVSAVFSPVWVDDRLVAMLGLFYKEPPGLTAVSMAEIQAVSGFLAGQRRLARAQRECARLQKLAEQPRH